MDFFALDNDVIILHDNPYSELTSDGYEAPNFLTVDGAKEVGIELNSLSKTYNMTGWRIGSAVGNAEILKGVRKVKTNVDWGTFQAVQVAGIAALTGSQDCIKRDVEIWQERRDILFEGLRSAGIEVRKPKTTFYLWAKVPQVRNSFTSPSIQFSLFLLEHADLVVIPGIGFGEHEEGFIRLALCASVERIKEACERIKGLNL